MSSGKPSTVPKQSATSTTSVAPQAPPSTASPASAPAGASPKAAPPPPATTVTTAPSAAKPTSSASSNQPSSEPEPQGPRPTAPRSTQLTAAPPQQETAAVASLADVYLQYCKDDACHVNKTLLKQFRGLDAARQPAAEQASPPGEPSDSNPAASTAAIRILDFTRNVVGPKGIMPLLKCIQHHSGSVAPSKPSSSPPVAGDAAPLAGLQVIRLCNNSLTNESVFSLVASVTGHPSLRSINLSGNPISHAAGKALHAFVKANTLIHEMELRDTLINPALIRLIQAQCAASAQDHAAEKTASTAAAAAPASPPPSQKPAAPASAPSTLDNLAVTRHFLKSDHVALAAVFSAVGEPVPAALRPATAPLPGLALLTALLAPPAETAPKPANGSAAGGAAKAAAPSYDALRAVLDTEHADREAVALAELAHCLGLDPSKGVYVDPSDGNKELHGLNLLL